MKKRIKEFNYIYITFLVTNTGMGKLIRTFTNNQFSHVTVSFDKDLRQMYSFARYHINSPISGGFVIERPHRYLNSDQDVMVKICELKVTKEESKRILKELSYFKQNQDIMIYNTMNALLSLLRKRISVKNMFTCLEFVTHLMQYPDMLAIEELEQRLEPYVIYQGSLRAIAKHETLPEEDTYFNKRRRVEVALDTIFHFHKVVGRLLAG